MNKGKCSTQLRLNASGAYIFYFRTLETVAVGGGSRNLPR
jgi:hypothetical protein